MNCKRRTLLSLTAYLLFFAAGCFPLKKADTESIKNRSQAVEVQFSKNVLTGEPYDFSVFVKSDSADTFMTPVVDFSSVGLPNVYILNNSKLFYLYQFNNIYVYGNQVTLYSRGTYRIKVFVEWADGSFCSKSVQFRVL